MFFQIPLFMSINMKKPKIIVGTQGNAHWKKSPWPVRATQKECALFCIYVEGWIWKTVAPEPAKTPVLMHSSCKV